MPLLLYTFAKQMVFKVATNAFDKPAGIKVSCFLLTAFFPITSGKIF